MTDLETLMRETLTDDRRRLTVPHDPVRWVQGAVGRQRRRNALVGVAATTVVALAAAAVVVPMLTDVEATYVAGRPDAESGLLAWKPVGTLVEEPDVMTSAVEAWERLADDEPVGDVHLVAGERWDDTEMVVLQAETDSGAASIALLTSNDGAAGPWELRDTSRLPQGAEEVEALLLPDGTAPSALKGGDDTSSLILAPRWRSERTSELGWQLTSAGADVGEEATWLTLNRASGYPWWAPLGQDATGLPPSTAVLDHGQMGKARRVPVLELGDSSRLGPLTSSDVTFRVLPGDGSRPHSLEDVRDVVQRLDLTDPVTATVFSSGSGEFSFGTATARESTRTLFAQFESEGEHVLVAYATTGGEISCFSSRSIPRDVTSLSFVGMGCHVPVAGGARGGVQGNEVWAGSFIDKPDLKTSVLDISVTLVRSGGQSTTHDLGDDGYGLGIAEEATRPVQRYVFTAVETFDGAQLKPRVWPGWAITVP